MTIKIEAMQKISTILKMLCFVLVLLLNERAEAQSVAKDVSRIDKDKKVAPIQVTAMNGRHNQLLYFTSTSLLNDDRHLIYMSDLDGNPNIFMRDILTGKEIQLSHNTDGFLKSYVYFDGKPYRGFGKASVSVDNANGRVYYLQGRNIMVADTLGNERILAQYPEGQMTAFTHVSADGSNRIEIPLPEGWKRYGHFTEGGAGMLVTDGYYTEPDDNLIPNAPKSGLWICFLKADWVKKQLTWIPLCQNGSSWRSQDEHPHPIFNHASDAVYFTSDKDGKRAVYKVELKMKGF